MLGRYLNQAAEYKPQTGTDTRGQPIYGPATTIACRKQMETQMLKTDEGKTIKAEWVYYLTHPVSVGDSLDGREVQLVNTWTMLGGGVAGYKAVV